MLRFACTFSYLSTLVNGRFVSVIGTGGQFVFSFAEKFIESSDYFLQFIN